MIDSFMVRLSSLIEMEGRMAAPVNECFLVDFDFKGEVMTSASIIQMGERPKSEQKRKTVFYFMPRIIPD